MKKQKLKLLILAFTFTFYLLPFTFYAPAQDNDRLATLTAKIIEAQNDKDLYAAFEELKELYFKDNKYPDFVAQLKSLGNKKKKLEPFANYYIVLARYRQLKYLEETQNWDDYFSNGNTYRDEITKSAQKTIDTIASTDPLSIYAKLILWKFHRDQQDALSESSLSELMSAVLGYPKNATYLLPLKDVAAELLSYGEKGKAKEIYKIYVNNLVMSDIKEDELKNIALGFYKEGNPELSQLVYDAYIEKITKSYSKDKLMPILIDIAKDFSYSATGGSALGGKDSGSNDPFYAEKIFQKIEEKGGRGAFDEELIYLRAFNLEKSKEYSRALEIYKDLVQRYPHSIHADEAVFKGGIIYTYVLRDLKSGRVYFEKLAKKETPSPQVISSFYQLGLLSQWEQDELKAKEYYNRLIENARGDLSETANLAKERLKEIAEAKPIEYNLKTFLDVSLKEEYASFNMTKLDLRSHPYKIKKDENVNITSVPYAPESGCMQVELQYLWSGNTGTTKPSLEQPSFDTIHTRPGTKEINLVVVSPTGIIDRSIDMVDVD